MSGSLVMLDKGHVLATLTTKCDDCSETHEFPSHRDGAGPQHRTTKCPSYYLKRRKQHAIAGRTHPIPADNSTKVDQSVMRKWTRHRPRTVIRNRCSINILADLEAQRHWCMYIGLDSKKLLQSLIMEAVKIYFN
jgi:hypothetical protein